MKKPRNTASHSDVVTDVDHLFFELIELVLPSDGYNNYSDIPFFVRRNLFIASIIPKILFLCSTYLAFILIHFLLTCTIRHYRRPASYARENERRRALRSERRKIRPRSTSNPCPSPDEIRVAWANAKTSHAAMLHLGGMLHDLECYVDNALRFDDSHQKIVGRNGGIKAWLWDNVPELCSKYKTLMRYKAMAKKLRQIAAVRDPVPTSAIMDSDVVKSLLESCSEKPTQVSLVCALDEFIDALASETPFPATPQTNVSAKTASS